MNKTHKVLPVEDYYVVVDEEASFDNDWYIDTKAGNLRKGANNYLVGGYKKKVIATIGKTIEGLECIELPDTNPLKALLDRFRLAHSRSRNDISDAAYMWVVEEVEKVYKAATKTYSEKDMIAFAQAFYEAYEKEEVGSAKAMIHEFTKSLQPVPIEVTLEYEESKKYFAGENGGVDFYDQDPPKLKSPIKVVEVKYAK
jgi:hypothetical protein